MIEERLEQVEQQLELTCDAIEVISKQLLKITDTIASLSKYIGEQRGQEKKN